VRAETLKPRTATRSPAPSLLPLSCHRPSLYHRLCTSRGLRNLRDWSAADGFACSRKQCSQAGRAAAGESLPPRLSSAHPRRSLSMTAASLALTLSPQRAWSSYNAALQRHPLRTKAVTCLASFVVGDGFAQLSSKSVRRAVGVRLVSLRAAQQHDRALPLTPTNSPSRAAWCSAWRTWTSLAARAWQASASCWQGP